MKMLREMVVRAWKDPDYRKSLSDEQLAALPENPSGMPLAELGEAELDYVVGGVGDRPWKSAPF